MRNSKPKRPTSDGDGFIRGFGCCASVTIMLVGAVILGIMIGIGMKDLRLIRQAEKSEAPVKASDLQNVFVKRNIINATAPLILSRINSNATRQSAIRPFTSRSRNRPLSNNVTAKVEKNIKTATEVYSFEQARTLCSKVRGDIHTYWDIDQFPEFKKTMDFPKETWDVYKKRLQNLLVHPNSTKKFTIAFGGSSVTAGHDNFLNESYPTLVRKQLWPIFQLLGVQLQVQNVGIGNNPCFPYDMCMEAHIPPTVDIISWEQSLNCGRDAEPVEAFLRTSALTKKQPMVLLMTSGTPYWEPEECAGVSSAPVPLTKAEIMESKLPLNILANRSTILNDFPFLQVDGGVNLAKVYEKVLPIAGQNLNGLAAYKCKGPYGADFGKKTLGKGKNWHPGVQGHKLRADSFTYFMSTLISSALTEIVMFQQAKTSSSKKRAFVTAVDKKLVLSAWDKKKNPLPKPVVCDNSICLQNVKPTCKTMIQPQYGALNNLKRTLMVPNSVPPGWTAELSWLDVNGVAKAQAEKRNYLDKKMIFVSDSNTTQPIEFRLTPAAEAVVWLCQVSRGFAKYPDSMGDLGTAAVVSVESLKGAADAGNKGKDKKMPTSILTLTKVKGDHECFASKEKIKGPTKLSIQKVKASVQVNLAYLIFW